MAWNEPNGNKKDPWKGGANQGPPDLDEALRKLQKRLNQVFNMGSKDGGGLTPNGGLIGAGMLVAFVFVLWLLSGIVIIGPAEKAAVLRFGHYNRTIEPGPHWVPRFVDSVYKLNVDHLYTYETEDLMLNKEENILSAKVSVIYRKSDPRLYYFNVVNPEVSLQQATASALRQVVGHTSLDDVLTVGREKMRDEVFSQLKTTLDRYQTGIIISDVRIQSTKAPDEVKAAFDDAIKAREDLERYRNQAQAYSAKVIPLAKGNAKRIYQEAEAYKNQQVFKAQGEVSQFLFLLPEYKKAPKVTRERLYLATLQDVFSNTTKILLDGKASQNMMYLPLEQLLKNAQPSSDAVVSSGDADSTALPPLVMGSSRSARPGFMPRMTREEARDEQGGS